MKRSLDAVQLPWNYLRLATGPVFVLTGLVEEALTKAVNSYPLGGQGPTLAPIGCGLLGRMGS